MATLKAHRLIIAVEVIVVCAVTYAALALAAIMGRSASARFAIPATTPPSWSTPVATELRLFAISGKAADGRSDEEAAGYAQWGRALRGPVGLQPALPPAAARVWNKSGGSMLNPVGQETSWFEKLHPRRA